MRRTRPVPRFLIAKIVTLALFSPLALFAQLPEPDRFPAPPGAGPWLDLFDGKTLDGWSKHGGSATYRVEKDCVVGTTAPNTPNTFLCTDRTFHDFELEYEFRIDPALNSGVQIRSAIDDKDRVRGYQVEIDVDLERKRFWSAGIYEEGGRGWLADLSENPEARAAAKPHGWNQVRVLAEGGRIRTWINGVPAADLLDVKSLEGLIGLQVHGVGKREDPLEVRWRKIRLREHGRTAWEPRIEPAHWRYSSAKNGLGKTIPVPLNGADWRWTRSGWSGKPTTAEGVKSELVSAKPRTAGALRFEFRAGKDAVLHASPISWGPEGLRVLWRSQDVPLIPGVSVDPLDSAWHSMVIQRQRGRIGVTLDGKRICDAPLVGDPPERNLWAFGVRGDTDSHVLIRSIEETAPVLPAGPDEASPKSSDPND